MSIDKNILSRLNPGSIDPLAMHDEMQFVVTLKQLRMLRARGVQYGAAMIDQMDYASRLATAFNECLSARVGVDHAESK